MNNSYNHKVKYLILFLLPLSIFSQNIRGKVYDSETTAKGIDVFNISTKTRTLTDVDGNFTIKASVNDTLSFHSLFHNQKIIVLNQVDFDDVLVVELSKTINRLQEILLQNNIDPNDFNTVKEEQKIKKTITKDSKVNPHLYEPSSQYGLDFIRLAGLVSKMFKNKRAKDKANAIIPSKTLDSLFKNDTFFNKQLLTEDLKIEESQEQRFYEFCETMGISKKLINKNNKLLLLEQFVNLSQAYLKKIETAQEN